MKNIKISKKTIFYTVFAITLVLSFNSIVMSNAGNYLRLLFSDINDSFMDFFNPIVHACERNPYTSSDRIYPAIAYLFYYIISLCIPFDYMEYGGRALRLTQEGLFVFCIYMVLTTMFLTLVLYQCKKGTMKEKIGFLICTFLSGGFAYQFERANIIIIALICLLFFVFFRNSSDVRIREMALIMLAVSASIKIYPALFGLLLLKEKKWKESIRTVCYGVVIFVLPFFTMGGLGKIVTMIKSLVSGVSYTADIGFAYKLNISNTLNIIGAMLGIELSFPLFCQVIMLLVSIACAWYCKSEWKTCAILSLNIILIPGISFYYSLIFMVIPLILFLDEKETKSKMDYVYAILYALAFSQYLFIPDDYFAAFSTSYRLNFTTFFVGCILILFLLLLLVEIVAELVEKQRALEGNQENV